MPAMNSVENGFGFKADTFCEIDFTIKRQTEFVDPELADGRICAFRCGIYPPSIPLFLDGEVIKNASVLKNFRSTFGLYDGKIKVYK